MDGFGKLEGHLVGAFPRSENLIDLTRAVTRGKFPRERLDNAFTHEASELATAQTDAELDFVVDGQLNWQDLFRPFSEILGGLHQGSLTRWFDNNTFYRKPIIVDKVKCDGTNLRAYFRSDLLTTSVRKKAILPGPFTFALMSQNMVYDSVADLIDDLAHCLREVVSKLLSVGYEYFQFNEPCICFSERSQDELSMIEHAYDSLVKGMGARTALHTYFGDVSTSIDSILDFSIDRIGVDLYATSIDALADHDFDKEIGCGCIDARNSLLESPETLENFVKKVEDRVSPKGIYVTPNCDLEYLPHSIAVKKVQILSQVMKMAA